jgi:single-strand DNA-binding protein
MSNSINKLMLVGTVIAEPEIKETVATIVIETSEPVCDLKTRKIYEKIEQHNVVFTEWLIDVARNYVHKDSKVYIIAKLEDTQIVGRSIQILNSDVEAERTVESVDKESLPVAD